MIEQKTMFGVAAIGFSAVVGYGLYKYVRGRQHTRKIKEAVDEMVRREIFMILLVSLLIWTLCTLLESYCI